MRRHVVTRTCGAIGVVTLTVWVGHAQTTLSSSSHPIYRNHVYNFEVTVPSGVTYTRTMPPNPDHGLGITLDNRAQLWVDASLVDSSSTEEQAKNLTAGCRVEEKRSATLGKMPAIMMRFSCDANADASGYIEQVVLSVSLRKNRSPICYQVGIRTNAAAISAQEDKLFGELVAGFRSAK